MMTETTAILTITLVALGAYNWHLHTIIQDLNDQLNNFLEMVMEMAKELQELGSPNVKVVDDKIKKNL
jgi:hypothetical protein